MDTTIHDHFTAKRLTVKDLAERMGVAAVTVRRWIDAGEAPPHIRIGRTIRFRLEDVEAWEAEHAADHCQKTEESGDLRRRLLRNLEEEIDAICRTQRRLSPRPLDDHAPGDSKGVEV